MSFTSVAFLVFLPVVWAIYWCLRRREWQNLLLVCASYVFYGWWDARFCVLMLTSSLVDYGLGLALGRSAPDSETGTGFRRRRLLLALSLAANLGLLGVFKYFGFFVDSFQAAATLLGWSPGALTLEIILPVGISFYTFQTLSYTIDIYRGRLQPTRNLVDYLAFVSFFPQLVAGPIERASRLLPQFQQPRCWDRGAFGEGLRQMLWGLFKKVVIADSLAGPVAAAFASPETAGGPRLMVATVLFAYQIYCDFSGYSDIAIGTARLFGIGLMRNFAYPYFSQSIVEFWQRWHISLSTWFRDYVYIALGGNRGRRMQTWRNAVVTFLVSGLWHGAAWRFVAWGGLHGVSLVALPRPPEKVSIDHPGGTRLVPAPVVLLRMILVFTLVCAFWVFFRADSLADAWLVWKKIATEIHVAEGYRELVLEYQGRGPLFGITHLLVVFLVIEWLSRHKPHPVDFPGWPRPLRWSVYSALAWFVIEYGGRGDANPFIYFQF
ncbi:MAG: alginate O-acetyltransferase [Planctomycetaceae bacterium]|nr:alginate O-acetyltransferase [Planctomycetaceae bacterium]